MYHILDDINVLLLKVIMTLQLGMKMPTFKERLNIRQNETTLNVEFVFNTSVKKKTHSEETELNGEILVVLNLGNESKRA